MRQRCLKMAWAPVLSSAVHTGYMALVCAPGLFLACRMYSLYKQGTWPIPSIKKTLAAAIGVLLPRNLPAAAYSLLTLAFAGMAAMCLSANPGEAMKFYPGLHGKATAFNSSHQTVKHAVCAAPVNRLH
jgi:hypothetical protein